MTLPVESLDGDPINLPALQSRLAYLESIHANSPYGLLVVGPDGRIQAANPRTLEIIGYAQDMELSGLPMFIELFTPEYRAEINATLIQDPAPLQTYRRLECQVRTGSGALVPIELRGAWIKLPEPAGLQLVCHLTDIAHHYEIEEALRASEGRYRFLVENQGEGVIMIDAKTRIDYINPAGASLLDEAPEAIVGRPLDDFIPASQRQHLRMQIEKRRSGLSNSYELTIRSARNVFREVLVTATPRYTPEGIYNGTLAIFRDITDRKRQEEYLRYQSTHDAMTGLFNRAHFDDVLNNNASTVSATAGIIIVDVDGLKQVNDQDGHQAGDQLIQKVATILLRSFRLHDIVARIGGDEFAVVLPDTTDPQLRRAIRRVKHNLEEANAHLPVEKQVSFSIGGATTAPNRSLAQAMVVADQRMYRQKRNKKANLSRQS